MMLPVINQTYYFAEDCAGACSLKQSACSTARVQIVQQWEVLNHLHVYSLFVPLNFIVSKNKSNTWVSLNVGPAVFFYYTAA